MTERLAWGKFSWSDWENDPALALVSMGAQGFWMRLLCIAAKEGGYVRVAGSAPTSAKLARIVRASETDVNGWLAELEEEHVFSRTADGTIYSRRMVREAQKSLRNRKNGALGGNPTLRKDTTNPASVNPQSEPPAQPPENQGLEHPVKAEEKREEREESPPCSPPRGTSDENPIAVRKADVESIWQAAPKPSRERSSKTDVERALKAAANRGKPPDLVRRGLAAYWASDQATKDGGAFVKGIHRMIEGDRWESFLDAGETTALPLRGGPPPDDPWPKRIREYRRNAYWNRLEWGPPPGKPGCTLSPEVQMAHGYTPAAAMPEKGAA